MSYMSILALNQQNATEEELPFFVTPTIDGWRICLTTTGTPAFGEPVFKHCMEAQQRCDFMNWGV
jgi:hypothetical protein